VAARWDSPFNLARYGLRHRSHARDASLRWLAVRGTIGEQSGKGDYRNDIMIKVLKELFGKTSREPPAKKRAPIAAPEGASATGNYRAVSLAPNLMCCKAATHAMGKRVLLSEAPRLPLKDCTMPKNCTCKFRKNADRRDCDRRLFGAAGTTRWFAGTENRNGGCRRSMAK
jgi:hypothetical protein